MIICGMIIIIYCSVSGNLTKTVINTYEATQMHSRVKHYNIHTCMYIYYIDNTH